MAIFGKPSGMEVPEGIFPYFREPLSKEEELEMRQRMDAALVWDGEKHVWKD